MTTFEVYNDAGAGFDMTASAASGWIATSADPADYYLYYDDGHVAQFDVVGLWPVSWIEVTYTYDWWSDTAIIHDISYVNYDDWVILDIFDLELLVSGDDLYYGGAFLIPLNKGDDVFGGNDYVDIVYAGPGDDELWGYGSNDFLSGDAGDDWLDGMLGNDVLSGGTGFDYLDDKAGKDQLFGGADADTFYFGKGYKKDTIKDLSLSLDTVMIQPKLAKNLGDIREVADSYKGGVVLKFSNSDQLKIEDIKMKQWKAIDFDFA